MKNVQREIKEMLTAVAEKQGCSYELVEAIFLHEFEFIAKQITKGEKGKLETFENILVKHFGSFLSNERYILKLKQINDDKIRSEVKDNTTSI
jgi:hypothetical protein